MTLRLFHDYFIGKITTIGYDYSRICYDYFSRNAATIADLYWLSGESPKRDTAQATNGSAPPAALLLLDCLAWIHNRGAPLRPYIHYYNRAVVLTCTASSVALASGIRWRASGRCDTLQRCAGGIIVTCAGLLSYAVEWFKLPETPL